MISNYRTYYYLLTRGGRTRCYRYRRGVLSTGARSLRARWPLTQRMPGPWGDMVSITCGDNRGTRSLTMSQDVRPREPKYDRGVFVVKTAGPGGHLRDGPTRHGLGGRPGPVGVGCELDDESNCDDRRYS